MRASHDDRVGQPQPVVIGTQLRSSLGHGRRQWSHGNPHRSDGVASVGEATGAGKRDERFAVRACGGDERVPGEIG